MSKVEAIDDDHVLITLDEGVPYTVTIALANDAGAPINLTGLVCKMQARLAADDAATVLEKTEAAGLVNGGAAGTITINFLAADSTNTTWQRAVFDVKVAGLLRPVSGAIEINRAVTV